MDLFWIIVISIVLCALYAFIGAHAIRQAIIKFNSGKYFLFGLYIMTAVTSAAGIFDLFLGG